jgi:glycosyltransferase involved in cell wall biosynthesis
VIGNFVDEAGLDGYRSSLRRVGALRAVFLATLSERKQPLLAIQAIHELRRAGVDIVLDVIGTGPLAAAVAAEVARLGLHESVILHGHLSNPYKLLAAADLMLLPSLSEGVPRSALEALHLGVPCVLRAVDGNADLITTGQQGALFEDARSLSEAVQSVAQSSRARSDTRSSLLPARFRQNEQARQYLALVEQDE